MVTTKHICDICKDDSFKTFEEAKEHAKLPIIEGNYEGKICILNDMDYGILIKDNSISPNKHERNYQFVMLFPKSQSNYSGACSSSISSFANVTEIQEYLKNGICKPVNSDELNSVNNFLIKLPQEIKKIIPKPTSENGYESI